jgi:hypothetical protein
VREVREVHAIKRRPRRYIFFSFCRRSPLKAAKEARRASVRPRAPKSQQSTARQSATGWFGCTTHPASARSPRRRHGNIPDRGYRFAARVVGHRLSRRRARRTGSTRSVDELRRQRSAADGLPATAELLSATGPGC